MTQPKLSCFKVVYLYVPHFKLRIPMAVRRSSYILLFLAARLFAQPHDEGIGQASFGIFTDLSYNRHSANFQGLPGVPSCCPRYESGTGTGPVLGGIYQLPLTPLFDLQLRAIYHSLSAMLSATETTDVLQNNQSVPG